MKRILEITAGILLAVGILVALAVGITVYTRRAAEQETVRQYRAQEDWRLAQEKQEATRKAAKEACRKTYARCILAAAGSDAALDACGAASIACHARAER